MILRRRFLNLPIRYKLTAVAMVASVAALLVAAVALVGYDVLKFRQKIEQDLEILAKGVVNQASAAIGFGDVVGAQEVLATLKENPHIETAYIFKDGEVLSQVDPQGQAFVDLADLDNVAVEGAELSDELGYLLEQAQALVGFVDHHVDSLGVATLRTT